MVFTEEVFLFYFMPFFLLVYYLLPYRKNAGPDQTAFWVRNFWITIMSYAFYGWFEPWYVTLMWISSIMDYYCGRVAGNFDNSHLKRKSALLVSMIGNLSLLGVFKYAVFAQVNANWILNNLGQPAFQIFYITLPIGISFYTFQTMSYTIDVYMGSSKPVKSFADFSCFVALFPQLIAGPIVRYNTIEEQLNSRKHTMDLFSRGLMLFMLGFGLKILLANPAGRVADAAFAVDRPDALVAWWGIIAYSFQIYFDFNGYSTMACGLGMMLGFEFLKNFDDPYHADSITNFWQRWHISLSTFLRDYLYIPLGGNRKGNTRTYINLALVMLLGGMWHGAQWQFIVWGAIHGSWLALERWSGKKPFYGKLPRFVRVAITMFIVLIAWVFFRAENLAHAFQYIQCMFGAIEPGTFASLSHSQVFATVNVIEMIICAFFIYQPLQAYDMANKITWPRVGIAMAAFAVGIVMMYTQAFNPFLYFQF